MKSTFAALCVLAAVAAPQAARAQGGLTEEQFAEINCVYSGISKLEDDAFYDVVDSTIQQVTEGELFERSSEHVLTITKSCADKYEWDDTEVAMGISVGVYGAIVDATTGNLDEDGVLDAALAAVDAAGEAMSDDDLGAVYDGKLFKDAALRGRVVTLLKANGMPEVKAATMQDTLTYLEAMTIGLVYTQDWIDYAGF